MTTDEAAEQFGAALNLDQAGRAALLASMHTVEASKDDEVGIAHGQPKLGAAEIENADPYTASGHVRLPLQVTGFVGRQRDMAELARLIQTSRMIGRAGEAIEPRRRLRVQRVITSGSLQLRLRRRI